MNSKLNLSISILSLSLVLSTVTPVVADGFIDDNVQAGKQMAKRAIATAAADKIVEKIEYKVRVDTSRVAVLPDGTHAPLLKTGRIYNELAKEISAKVITAGMAVGGVAGAAPGAAAYGAFTLVDNVPILNAYINNKISKAIKNIAKEKLANLLESDAFYKGLGYGKNWLYDTATSTAPTQREVEWEELNAFFNSTNSSDQQMLADLDGDSLQSERLGRYWKNYIAMLVKQTVRNAIRSGTGEVFEVISRDLLDEFNTGLKGYSTKVTAAIGGAALAAGGFVPVAPLIGVPLAFGLNRGANAGIDRLAAKLHAKRKMAVKELAVDLGNLIVKPSNFEIMRPDRKMTSETVQVKGLKFELMSVEDANLGTYANAAVDGAVSQAQSAVTAVTGGLANFGTAIWNWRNPPKPTPAKVEVVTVNVETPKVEMPKTSPVKKGWFSGWNPLAISVDLSDVGTGL